MRLQNQQQHQHQHHHHHYHHHHHHPQQQQQEVRKRKSSALKSNNYSILCMLVLSFLSFRAFQTTVTASSSSSLSAAAAVRRRRRASFAFVVQKGWSGNKNYIGSLAPVAGITQQQQQQPRVYQKQIRLYSTTAPPPSSIEAPTNMTSPSSSSTTTTSTSPQPPKIQARKVSATPTSLAQCGKRLAQNKLVSFPTETVYGLGCHALSESAIQKVFQAKERPLTDPLIVHVNSFDEAKLLWNATFSCSEKEKEEEESEEQKVLQILTTQFWPGPLTIVAPAHLPSVPSIIMANTGYVACRSPSHPIARSLIKEAGVPIAAPSANKFGHVSPTRAVHVWDDLKGEDVWIVDPDLNDAEEEEENEKKRKRQQEGGEEEQQQEEEEKKERDVVLHHQQNTKTIVCDVGVESTVIKVEAPSSSSSSSSSKGKITILRHGAISLFDLKSTLHKHNLLNSFQVLDKVTQKSTASSSSSSSLEERKKEMKQEEHIAHVAPGQTIRHYSPNVLSYLLSSSRNFSSSSSSSTTTTTQTYHRPLSPTEKTLLSKAVVIDYKGTLQSLENYALAYRDLSVNGNSKEAASRVFEMLRWSEEVVGAERVYFPELIVKEEEEEEDDDALILAVKDRLTRAASGVVIDTLC